MLPTSPLVEAASVARPRAEVSTLCPLIHTLDVGSLGKAGGSSRGADSRQSQTGSGRETGSVLAGHTASRARSAGDSADGRALNDGHGAKFRSKKEVRGQEGTAGLRPTPHGPGCVPGNPAAGRQPIAAYDSTETTRKGSVALPANASFGRNRRARTRRPYFPSRSAALISDAISRPRPVQPAVRREQVRMRSRGV